MGKACPRKDHSREKLGWSSGLWEKLLFMAEKEQIGWGGGAQKPLETGPVNEHGILLCFSWKGQDSSFLYILSVASWAEQNMIMQKRHSQNSMMSQGLGQNYGICVSSLIK